MYLLAEPGQDPRPQSAQPTFGTAAYLLLHSSQSPSPKLFLFLLYKLNLIADFSILKLTTGLYCSIYYCVITIDKNCHCIIVIDRNRSKYLLLRI